MIKKLFVIGAIALGLVACNSGEETQAEEAHEHDTEMHEDDHDHDHEAADHNHDHDANAMASEDALFVPEGARVFFANLEDGQTVTSPFIVEFGIEGMEVKPAGELVKGTGHHHILIGEGFTEVGVVVPADEKHIHFGDGSTSTELTLEPGEYMISLQFANGIHQSYGEQMSATINVIVE